MRRPPLIGRMLLRLVPLGARRAEAEADLAELFEARLATRGYPRAAGRYLRDVCSLLVQRPPATHLPRSIAPWRPVEGLVRDLVYAVRMFSRQPITIGITVLGLGLAIGVSGAVFTLMNAAVLRSDGVRDAARAPRVLRTTPNGVSTAWGYDEYVQLRDAARQSRVEAWLTDAASYAVGTALLDDPPSIPIAFVTGGYMDALYARAAAGRILATADADLSGPPVVVVSHAFWTRYLAADPATIGRTIRIGGATATIVGIAERRFAAPFTNGIGVWMPISTYHVVHSGKAIGAGSRQPVNVVARLAPGATVAAAEAELTAIAGTFEISSDPARLAGARFDQRSVFGRPGSQQFTVAIAVTTVIALVLLLACVNVASVLLANATTRQREISVRLALGATPGRIVRQLLTESCLIATAASSTGLILTTWLAPMLARLTRAPATLDVGFDVTVYLFFVTVAVACGIVAGFVPSRVGGRGNIVSPLKGSGFTTSSPAPRRLRSALLGVQAAASILLLVLATLFLRATIRAARVEVGLDVDRLVALSVGFGRGTDAARTKAYWSRAVESVSALPGVERVALAELPPFGGASRMMTQEREGKRQVIYFNKTSASYFDTVGLRVIRGRVYTDEEVARDARMVVISETVAHRYWPGGDPLGTTFESVTEREDVVIGIVSDAIVARLHEGTHGAVYGPLAPSDSALGRLVVRTDGNLAMTVPRVRDTLRGLDPTITVQSTLLKEGLEEEVSRPRIIALIAGSMAALAVILAAIGLYGITAAVVGQRTREIGLRIALGAERRDVLRLLMRESLRPVLGGLAAGIVLALLAGRAIASALFGVAPHDPLAFGLAVTILLVSAIAAVFVPTRSASRVDPAFVLRQV